MNHRSVFAFALLVGPGALALGAPLSNPAPDTASNTTHVPSGCPTPDDTLPAAPLAALICAAATTLAAASPRPRGNPRQLPAVSDADQRLEQLQREHQLFLQGPVAAFRWRAQDGWPVEYASPNVAALFGRAAGDLLSGQVAYAELIHPDDRARVTDELAALGAAGAARLELEYRIVRPLGDARWLHSHLALIRDASGTVTHYEGHVFDITERRRAEDALRQGEARFRALYEESPVGIVTVTLPGQRILSANRTFCEMLAYNETELRRFTLRDITHPDDVEQETRQAHLLNSPGAGPYTRDKRCLTRDGRLVWVIATSSVIRGPDGQPLCGISIHENITKRKEAEQERELLLAQLRDALAKVKMLRGLIPICSACKRIRDDHGFWERIDVYIRNHADVEFTHGLCPECAQRLYPDLMPFKDEPSPPAGGGPPAE